MSLEFPFEYANVEGIGKLFYPIVRLDLQTISGWKPFEFLVDTGADITTVPVSLLPVLGMTTNNLTQSMTFGVGGVAVQTWSFVLHIRLSNISWKIQANAVKTKANGVPLLLGRKDIFESRCNLLLDSKNKLTVINLN